MAWSWSHETEAYAAVLANIHKQPREWLEVVFAEWSAGDAEGGGERLR